MIVHVHVGVHVPHVGVEVGRNNRICSLLPSVGSRNRTQVFGLAQSGPLSNLTGPPILVLFFSRFHDTFLFCSLGWLPSHRNLSTSAPQVLDLKVGPTSLDFCFCLPPITF